MNKIILALDTSNLEDAINIAKIATSIENLVLTGTREAHKRPSN